MKKTEIIINDISMVVRIPSIAASATYGYTKYEVNGYEDVKIVDPTKLAAFLEKHVKTEDLIED